MSLLRFRGSGHAELTDGPSPRAASIGWTHYHDAPAVTHPPRAALLTGLQMRITRWGQVLGLNSYPPDFPGYVGELPPRTPQPCPGTLRPRRYETINGGQSGTSPLPYADTVPGGRKAQLAPPHPPSTNPPPPRSGASDRSTGSWAEKRRQHFFPRAGCSHKRPPAHATIPARLTIPVDWMNQGIRVFIRGALRASSPTKPFSSSMSPNNADALAAAGDEARANMARYRGRYDAGCGPPHARRANRRRSRWAPHSTAKPRLPPSDPRASRLGAERNPHYRAVYAGGGSWRRTPPLLDNRRPERRPARRRVSPIWAELDNTLVVFSSDNGGTDAGRDAWTAFNLKPQLTPVGRPPVRGGRKSGHVAHALGGPAKPRRCTPPRGERSPVLVFVNSKL
jgi:arylsulfatase A-like enzyme